MNLNYKRSHSPCFGKRERTYNFNNTTYIVESRYEDFRDKGFTVKETMENLINVDFTHSTNDEENCKMSTER